MGIIPKGKTVTVKGTEVKLVLHMRGRCEKYNVYDYTIGTCNPNVADLKPS